MTTITESLPRSPDSVRLARRLVQVHAGDPESGGGWGLHLVDRLTEDWGVEEGSTRVWFRLDFDKPPREL